MADHVTLETKVLVSSAFEFVLRSLGLEVKSLGLKVQDKSYAHSFDFKFWTNIFMEQY